MRENHDGTMLEPEDAIAVGYCGAIQPTRWTRHAIVMARPIFDVDDEDAVPVITNEDVYNIFQNISARGHTHSGIRSSGITIVFYVCQILYDSPRADATISFDVFGR